MEIQSIEIPITLNNLPKGLYWEEDGSCWSCALCDKNSCGCEWRWQPENLKALAKEKPEAHMCNFIWGKIK